MTYDNLLRQRLTHLLTKKGVTEYKMSLDLGRSKNYIRDITSERSLPSMSEFFYICEYLGVTPKEFFDEEIDNPALVSKVIQGISKLNDTDINNLLYTIDRFGENTK